MVIYNLKEETVNKVIYEYFPEKRGTDGTLAYLKNTGELVIEKVALEDKFKMYANKARSSILSGMQKKKENSLKPECLHGTKGCAMIELKIENDLELYINKVAGKENL